MGEGRLRLDELQVHRSAGGVVYEDEEGALRATIFEPPVVGAIDLNQLAEYMLRIIKLMGNRAAIVAHEASISVLVAA